MKQNTVLNGSSHCQKRKLCCVVPMSLSLYVCVMKMDAHRLVSFLRYCVFVFLSVVGTYVSFEQCDQQNYYFAPYTYIVVYIHGADLI